MNDARTPGLGDIFEWRGTARSAEPAQAKQKEQWEWRGNSRPSVGHPTDRKPRVDWAARHRELDASIGSRFGDLVVESRASRPDGASDRKLRVFVRCDCGAAIVVRFQSLTSGNRKTCGTSQHRDRDRLARGTSMIGERFGLLVVSSALAEGGEGNNKTQVMVKCECGAERRARVSDLRGGSILSCGGPAHRAIKPQAKRWEVHGSFMTYAVEAVGTKMIKIGRARDIHERMLDIQSMCPVPLRVIATCDEDIERRMHDACDTDRAHGEWFKYSDRVKAALLEHMQPASMDVALARPGCPLGGKHKCKVCGDLGHHAKTCRKQFTPPSPAATPVETAAPH